MTKEAESLTMRLFGRVGILGSIASLIGIPLAIYFYVQGSRHRELVYAVQAGRTIVVKTGQVSNLKVLLGSKELHEDVTAAQVAFWNSGAESIRPANMLSPLVIQLRRPNLPTVALEPESLSGSLTIVPDEHGPPIATQPIVIDTSTLLLEGAESVGIPIIEARVRKRSRDVIHLALDQSAADQGKLSVNWDILERDDGGVIQIVYAGGPAVEITALATIEGQGAVREQESAPRWLFPFWLNALIGIVATAWLVLVTAWLVLPTILRRPHLSTSILLLAMIALMGIGLPVISILSYRRYVPMLPPFGF